MKPGARAIAGALITLMVLNLGYVGARLALGGFDETYPINVVLGEIGQNVTSGSDVKVRGVLVGSVGKMTLNDELQAVAELVMKPQYKIPVRSTFAVTGKTLLGEKQVEIILEGPLNEGPFIQAGALITDTDRVVEFQDVLAELNRLFEAIPPEDLAVVIEDGIGAFDDQGAQIARAIDQGDRATDVGVRILDDQIPATRDLSLVAEALSTEGDEFNALGRESLRGLPTLSDNQERTREALDALERFAEVVDVTLEVTRPDFDRLVVNGDSVTRMLYAYTEEVGEVISGLNNYTAQYAGGGFTSEYTQGQAAYFQLLIDTGLQPELCPQLPRQMRRNLPLCTGQDPEDLPDLPDIPDIPDVPQPPNRVPLARMNVPADIVRPDQSIRLDATDLLERAAGRVADRGGSDG